MNATDRTAVGDDDSIGGRTFMAARRLHTEPSRKAGMEPRRLNEALRSVPVSLDLREKKRRLVFGLE